MSDGPRVRVHIDSLVLHGVGPVSREALADAVRSRLEQSLSKSDTWVPAEHEQVDGGSFPVRPAANARTLGGDIAGAVQRAIIATQP